MHVLPEYVKFQLYLFQLYVSVFIYCLKHKTTFLPRYLFFSLYPQILSVCLNQELKLIDSSLPLLFGRPPF